MSSDVYIISPLYSIKEMNIRIYQLSRFLCNLKYIHQYSKYPSINCGEHTNISRTTIYNVI